MTIRAALSIGVRELTKAHTHDPKGCAKFLLRHAIEKTSNDQSSAINLDGLLLSDPDYVISDRCSLLFREMLKRRALHEPAWYITNEAYFWKDAFFVDERVLIPRPETEILVEKALDFVKERSVNSEQRTAKKPITDHRSLFTVVDVGTGSGAIAISLTKELTGLIPVKMYSSDISPGAIEVAKLNAKRIGVEHLITFLTGDALEPFSEKVDLIVGNPPYIPTETVGGLAYDIHHFEPRVALDGGTDGLDVHRKILKKAGRLIRSGGAIFLEIGHDQGKQARKIAAEYFPTASIQIIKDYDGNDRILSIKLEGDT